MVNQATVTTPDIMADNGIIHIIDDVLLPPTIVDAAGYAGLTGLAGAVGLADPAVAKLLSGPGEFTVFAPDNAAFTAVDKVVQGLSQPELTGVLQYHVFPGLVDSASVPALADSLLQNTWGFGVTAVFDTTAGVAINGSNVTLADIKTTNGIVHVIDGVLLPPNIVQLAGLAGLTELETVLGIADGDLDVALSGPGPFTVFAPDNAAFGALATLPGSGELQQILTYHVTNNNPPLDAATLIGYPGEYTTLLFPQTLTVEVTTGGAVTVEGANVLIADVNGTNGIVHVIDTVLLPE